MSKIYCASSWRNESQPGVVEALRKEAHEVYDFRHPAKGNDGFSWRDVDPAWEMWSPKQFRAGLEHPVARRGYLVDMAALTWCDTCVLILPCGRSGHLEAGWAKGKGKGVVAYVPKSMEPELMYSMFDDIVTTMSELLRAVGS